MIHQVSMGTNDTARAKSFYDPLMSLNDFRLLKPSDRALHYGAFDIAFTLKLRLTDIPQLLETAFTWPFRRPDAHATAIAKGAPGIRENYNANYCGAFVRDLDGPRERGSSACQHGDTGRRGFSFSR